MHGRAPSAGFAMGPGDGRAMPRETRSGVLNGCQYPSISGAAHERRGVVV
jgi:hypothetical protein